MLDLAVPFGLGHSESGVIRGRPIILDVQHLACRSSRPSSLGPSLAWRPKGVLSSRFGKLSPNRLGDLDRNLRWHVAELFFCWWVREPRRGPKHIDPSRKVHDRSTPTCLGPSHWSRFFIRLLFQLVGNVLHFLEFEAQKVVVLLLSAAVLADHPVGTLATDGLGPDMPPRDTPVLTSKALLSMLPALSDSAATA
jgi:hypothetical protein